MGFLNGKKVIIIGDRDGVPGPAIEECVKTAGADVVYSSTERVKDFAEQYGAENIVVVLGAAEGEAAGLAAETVTAGDPTFAGPLTGVQLGLSVFHVCEPQIKDEVDAGVYDEQVGMMEMVMDVDDIISEMSSIRDEFCKYL